jgi:hypothetical protein
VEAMVPKGEGEDRADRRATGRVVSLVLKALLEPRPRSGRNDRDALASEGGHAEQCRAGLPVLLTADPALAAFPCSSFW